MTDRTARPRSTSASGLANAAGWEMRYDTGTSDKFYRVILVDGLVIVNWGRYGSNGEQKVHRMPDPAAARGQALELTGEKAGKGYWLSRDTTVFAVAEDLVAAARGSGRDSEPETRAAKDIIAGFTAASVAGRPPVAGSLAAHVTMGLAGALGADPAPAAAPEPAAAPPPPASRRRTPALKPAGEQTRPNGKVYRPRDLGGHEDIAFLRAARANHESVLLQGPPGTGKTALAEAAFAGRDGSGMETIGCTSGTEESDFLGTFIKEADGSWRWVAGPLLLMSSTTSPCSSTRSRWPIRVPCLSCMR